MRARAALLIVTLLLAGCGTPASSASPANDEGSGSTAPERPSPPADCVNPPPDITTVIEQSEPVACYGDDELVLEAHAVMLMGAVDCPGQLEPSWLHCVTLELYELPTTGLQPEILLAARVPNRGPALYAALHPSYEVDLSRGLDALVNVTGHFDDSEARTCRLVSWPDAAPPSPDDVIAGCRSTFVVTRLEPLEPPDPAAETPAPSASAFAIDDIAQVITTNLVVRTAPGIRPSSEIHPTALDAPALVYVIGGPVSGDGYEWYEVIPANLDYLPTGFPGSGWVAAGSREGEPWIGAIDVACPDPSSLLDVVSLSELGTIACFGSETVTLEGTFAGCRDALNGTPIIFAQGWPFGTLCTVTPDGLLSDVLPNPGAMIVHSDGSVALGDADIGARVRVTGHFDDPAARSCSFAGDAPMPPRFPVVLCRAQFVGTDLAVIEDPPS